MSKFSTEELPVYANKQFVDQWGFKIHFFPTTPTLQAIIFKRIINEALILFGLYILKPMAINSIEEKKMKKFTFSLFMEQKEVHSSLKPIQTTFRCIAQVLLWHFPLPSFLRSHDSHWQPVARSLRYNFH